MMNMYFKTMTEMKDIVFKGLDTTTVRDMVLFSVVCFLLTVIFEALQASKAVVVAKRKMNPLAAGLPLEHLDQRSLGSDVTSSRADLLSSLRIPTNMGVVRRQKLKLFALESLLHTIKFAYGYMLMLLVMTYCVWLLLAVILGSGLGYFFFHPVTSHLSQFYSRQPCFSSQGTCGDREEETGSGVMTPPSVNVGQDQPLILHT